MEDERKLIFLLSFCWFILWTLGRPQSPLAAGLHQGRREELSGGGLIRSLGGWKAIKAGDLNGSFIKSDERILGDGDFVEEVLSASAEKFERHYEKRRCGLDLDAVAKRAATVCTVEVDDVFTEPKQISIIANSKGSWEIREFLLSL